MLAVDLVDDVRSTAHLMLGTHGDQCVHARTAPLALAALCHRPHKLPTYATARWRPPIFEIEMCNF